MDGALEFMFLTQIAGGGGDSSEPPHGRVHRWMQGSTCVLIRAGGAQATAPWKPCSNVSKQYVGRGEHRAATLLARIPVPRLNVRNPLLKQIGRSALPV